MNINTNKIGFWMNMAALLAVYYITFFFTWATPTLFILFALYLVLLYAFLKLGVYLDYKTRILGSLVLFGWFSIMEFYYWHVQLQEKGLGNISYTNYIIGLIMAFIALGLFLWVIPVYIKSTDWYQKYKAKDLELIEGEKVGSIPDEKDFE